VPAPELDRLAAVYDRAMAEADPADKGEGSTTVRVHDFVNRGAKFDSLYIHPPVLEICRHRIGQAFKLSTLHGRTLRAGAPAQNLHVDYPADGCGWPMVGFIFMIDEFRVENGATLFLRRESEIPEPVCGPAGSMIVYNGSVLHGHGANRTDRPRRSIQGAYIRRDVTSWIDLASRMRPETLDRIGPMAKYLLGLTAEIESL
jgi:ectoine hydroxylase-related dioxygenase (phytanoyl-CoA dioxygenase family)